MKRIVSLLVVTVVIISVMPFINDSANASIVENECTTVSIPWNLINKCGHQAVSGPCQAYCWAYCRIILDNTAHTYRDYWTKYKGNDGKWCEGAKAPSAAGYASQSAEMTSKQILLETICNNVDLGRPVVVRVKGSKAFHYVVAIGYRINCNRNDLKESDILILNPSNKAINVAAGEKETYTYLSSCTLSQAKDGCYGCWTATSGGTSTVTSVGNNNVPAGRSSKPIVSVSNKNVTVSWEYSGSVSNYDIYLVQSPWRWEDIKYHLSSSSTSCTFENISPGDYRAFVIVRPNADNIQSEWTDCTVPAPEANQPSSMGPAVSDGVYTLVPQCAPNSRLDVANASTANKANIQICQENGSLAQQFLFSGLDDGYYSITAQVSGKALDVQEGKTASGTNVWQYNPNATDAQKWKLVDAGDGYYYIVPKLNTGLCLDVYAAKSTNGTNVQVYKQNQSSAQKWKLVSLSASSNRLPTNLTVTTSKDSYTLGEYVTITPSADNASHYAVTVWFGAFDAGKQVCSDSKFYSNITFTPPRAGTYAIRVDAINDAGYISAEKTFTVTDPGNSGSDDHQKRTWGEWSDWSANYATPSDTRQVETREVKMSDAHSEFRYGRYIDSTGSHGCWCAKYLESRSYTSGSAVLQYSDWTSTQYYANRTGWTCGYCRGDHIGVHHVGSDGRAWWAEFELPSGSYYWEETRWVDAVYETQYRYRDAEETIRVVLDLGTFGGN